MATATSIGLVPLPRAAGVHVGGEGLDFGGHRASARAAPETVPDRITRRDAAAAAPRMGLQRGEHRRVVRARLRPAAGRSIDAARRGGHALARHEQRLRRATTRRDRRVRRSRAARRAPRRWSPRRPARADSPAATELDRLERCRAAGRRVVVDRVRRPSRWRRAPASSREQVASALAAAGSGCAARPERRMPGARAGPRSRNDQLPVPRGR